MRVLLITEASATGVGKHVCDLAEGLVRRGHAVHLAYAPGRADTNFQQRVENANRTSNFLASPLEMRHQPSIRDVAAVGRTIGTLRRFGPFDIVHCHSTKAGFIGRLAAIGSRSAVVYTPHALATMDLSRGPLCRTALRWYEALFGRLSEIVIAVSEEELSHAASIGVPSDRLAEVSNGIDHSGRSPRDISARLELRNAWGIPDDSVCVGFVGRLTRQKSVPVLLTAFRDVLGSCPNAVLAIVGDGPLKNELIEQADRLQIGSAVRWCGEVDGRSAMNAFDILALTSQYEGFPYVLLEAMAAGIPVVTTAVGGVRALVEHGLNGFVSSKGEPAEIAEFLVKLIQSAALRERFSCRGVERSKLYSTDRMVESTITEYQRAIAIRHSQRQPADRHCPTEELSG